MGWCLLPASGHLRSSTIRKKTHRPDQGWLCLNSLPWGTRHLILSGNWMEKDEHITLLHRYTEFFIFKAFEYFPREPCEIREEVIMSLVCEKENQSWSIKQFAQKIIGVSVQPTSGLKGSWRWSQSFKIWGPSSGSEKLLSKETKAQEWPHN